MVGMSASRLTPIRRVAAVAAIVPLLVAAVLAAFAWTASRSAPRNLPVGVVAPASAAGPLTGKLSTGGFEVRTYATRAGATTGIEHRDVYAAIVVQTGHTTVLTASAASPSVSSEFAAEATSLAPGRVDVVDVVPLSHQDPRGAVLASAALPLVFGGMIVAALVTLLLGLRTAWRTLSALVIVSSLTALAAYLVAQGWLGALPGDHLQTWAAVFLTILAISSTVAGLSRLLGTAGVGVGAALMLFVGNPFSGITSAPELLPSAAGDIGRWMPPGAGANALRSTAYFHGNGAPAHVAVLLCWIAVGMIAVVIGHRRSARRAVAPQAAHRTGRHEIEAGHVPVRELVAASPATQQAVR